MARRASTALILLALSLLGACFRPPPEAAEDVSDAVVGLWLAFDGEEEPLRLAMLRVEEQLYSTIDVETSSDKDRSFSMERLSWETTDHIDHPDRDPALALTAAVVAASAFSLDAHQDIQLLDDHTEVDAYSPDKYDRIFHEGEECWLDQGCDLLYTENDLIKKNALMEVPYVFFKDFRWIDLDPEGDEPRWAYTGRSYQKETYEGESGKAVFWQSYTIEAWYPRDGLGPLDDASTEWTADSTGGGSTHLWAVWTEPDLGVDVSEETLAGTTRLGIAKNLDTTEEWLEDHGYQPDVP